MNGTITMPVPPPNESNASGWQVFSGYAGGIGTVIFAFFANKQYNKTNKIAAAKDQATAENLKTAQTAANIPLHEKYLNEQTQNLINGFKDQVVELSKQRAEDAENLRKAFTRIQELEVLHRQESKRAQDAELKRDIAMADAKRERDRANALEELLRQEVNTSLRQGLMADKLGEVGKAIVAIADTDTAVSTALASDAMKRPVHGADASAEDSSI